MENIEIKNGKWVTPIGNFGCQSFPIFENKKYFITDEELELLGQHKLKWHYKEEITQVEVDDKVIDKVITKCSLVENDNISEITLANARKELAEIKKWFIDNDWKPNKIITGEWLETDERWLEYKHERAIKRARQDELTIILNN